MLPARRAQRHNVLQIQPRRVPGFLHQPQKFVKIPARKRVRLLRHAAVVIKKMHRAQRGAVARGTAHGGEVFVKRRLVHIAQILLAEHRRDRAHLRRDGGVLVGQRGMVRAGVENAQRVAEGVQVQLHPAHLRRGGVCKVDGDHAADRRRGLVHQPAGLAEIHILRPLPDLRDLHRRKLRIAEEVIEDRSDQHLKRR